MNNSPSEIKLQSEAYLKFYNEYPNLRGRLFTITNNSENKIKGAINKAMGVYPGVSDMCYICENGKTLWIEWKKPKGIQSEAQKEWQVKIESLGHKYIIVTSFEEMMYQIGRN